MNLSRLKQLVGEYDNRKGLKRRLFGDAFQIRVLKELIRDKEIGLEVNSDPEITLQDYQIFASSKGYEVDLSDNYLASNSASSNIFAQWKLEQTNYEAIQQAVSRIPAIQIDWSSITSLSSINIEPLSLEVPHIDLSPISIDTTSILSLSRLNALNASTLDLPQSRTSLMEYLARQSEQQSFYSQFNQFTLFRYPTNVASTMPQYSARNNEEDNDDFYDHSPMCAPAA